MLPTKKTINAIVVESKELCETLKGKPFIRLKCKSQLTKSKRKGYRPTYYTLIVVDTELMEEVKELEIGSKINTLCECHTFLNKNNDALDISLILLDFIPLEGLINK